MLRVVGEEIVARHVQCGCEGVQVSVRFGLQCQVGLATLILDTLDLNYTFNTPYPSELVN
jgi:hypothetical protein